MIECAAAWTSAPAVSALTAGGSSILPVPAVDQLSRDSVEKAIAYLAGRASGCKLTPAGLSGGVFTVSNGCIYGSMMSTRIITHPSAAFWGCTRSRSG